MASHLLLTCLVSGLLVGHLSHSQVLLELGRLLATDSDSLCMAVGATGGHLKWLVTNGSFSNKNCTHGDLTSTVAQIVLPNTTFMRLDVKPGSGNTTIYSKLWPGSKPGKDKTFAANYSLCYCAGDRWIASVNGDLNATGYHTISRCFRISNKSVSLYLVMAWNPHTLTGVSGGGEKKEDCVSDVVEWDFGHGCATDKITKTDECYPLGNAFLNAFSFGSSGSKAIDRNKVNSNHMNCKIMKLANYTTRALSMLNTEQGELRATSLDNRLALEMMLIHQGGLCKYIQKTGCCSDVDNFQQNISDLIHKMHIEINNFHHSPAGFGIDGWFQGLFSWLHFAQWIPIIILCIVACVALNVCRR